MPTKRTSQTHHFDTRHYLICDRCMNEIPTGRIPKKGESLGAGPAVWLADHCEYCGCHTDNCTCDDAPSPCGTAHPEAAR